MWKYTRSKWLCHQSNLIYLFIHVNGIHQLQNNLVYYMQGDVIVVTIQQWLNILQERTQ